MNIEGGNGIDGCDKRIISLLDPLADLGTSRLLFSLRDRYLEGNISLRAPYGYLHHSTYIESMIYTQFIAKTS